MTTYVLRTVDETNRVAEELAQNWIKDAVVLLSGELGVGKTTFVRGVLRALDYAGVVRSPTFNLMQLYATEPPVMHADLYRVDSPLGIGLEEYFGSHLCFVEWPDRLDGLISPHDCWNLEFKFDGDFRRLTVTPPEVTLR